MSPHVSLLTYFFLLRQQTSWSTRKRNTRPFQTTWTKHFRNSLDIREIVRCGREGAFQQPACITSCRSYGSDGSDPDSRGGCDKFKFFSSHAYNYYLSLLYTIELYYCSSAALLICSFNVLMRQIVNGQTFGKIHKSNDTYKPLSIYPHPAYTSCFVFPSRASHFSHRILDTAMISS